MTSPPPNDLGWLAFRIEQSRAPAGDLAVMLGMKDQLSEEVALLNPLAARRARDVDLRPYDRIRHWNIGMGPRVTECEGAEIPRAVFLRDSFCNALIPLLSEHFGRAVYLWNDVGLAPAIIERERPNVVIFEIVERLLSVYRPGIAPALRGAPPAGG